MAVIAFGAVNEAVGSFHEEIRKSSGRLCRDLEGSIFGLNDYKKLIDSLPAARLVTRVDCALYGCIGVADGRPKLRRRKW